MKSEEKEEQLQIHINVISVQVLCNGARLGLLYKVHSLNCLPKPQHLELCFPWIQDTYKKGRCLWNFMDEVSGVQVFMSTHVCGLWCPTLGNPKPSSTPHKIPTPSYTRAVPREVHHFTHWGVITGQHQTCTFFQKLVTQRMHMYNTSIESYKLEGSKF